MPPKKVKFVNDGTTRGALLAKARLESLHGAELAKVYQTTLLAAADKPNVNDENKKKYRDAAKHFDAYAKATNVPGRKAALDKILALPKGVYTVVHGQFPDVSSFETRGAAPAAASAGNTSTSSNAASNVRPTRGGGNSANATGGTPASIDTTNLKAAMTISNFDNSSHDAEIFYVSDEVHVKCDGQTTEATDEQLDKIFEAAKLAPDFTKSKANDLDEYLKYATRHQKSSAQQPLTSSQRRARDDFLEAEREATVKEKTRHSVQAMHGTVSAPVFTKAGEVAFEAVTDRDKVIFGSGTTLTRLMASSTDLTALINLHDEATEEGNARVAFRKVQMALDTAEAPVTLEASVHQPDIYAYCVFMTCLGGVIYEMVSCAELVSTAGPEVYARTCTELAHMAGVEIPGLVSQTAADGDESIHFFLSRNTMRGDKMVSAGNTAVLVRHFHKGLKKHMEIGTHLANAQLKSLPMTLQQAKEKQAESSRGGGGGGQTAAAATASAAAATTPPAQGRTASSAGSGDSQLSKNQKKRLKQKEKRAKKAAQDNQTSGQGAGQAAPAGKKRA